MAIIKDGVYLKPEIEFPFCPGCGHTLLLKELDKALAKLKIDPLQTVFVTDIGCIGLSDQYFNVNAFHGLHGRSITYGCGLKLAQPNLTVIVIMGDGGLGIGGAHFLNAARRNLDITVIVANNFNFGMTGGEHSVTTPHGGKTSTTLAGNIEYPLDACSIVKAVDGGFAARITTFDKNISDILADAIQFKGFSLVDCWEFCTAYYVPRNKFNKQEMMKLLETYNFQTGIIHKSTRREYLESYIETYINSGKSKPKRLELKIEFNNKVNAKSGIIVAGAAGQKVKSSATIFGNAAILSGLYATQKDDYPITVMTGHSVSEIILSPQTINYTGIEQPDYLIITASEGLAKIKDIVSQMSQENLILTDSLLLNKLPQTQASVVSLPLSKIAAEFDKKSVTIVALSAFTTITRCFPVEALRRAVELTQKEIIADLSYKAIEAGIRIVKDSINK